MEGHRVSSIQWSKFHRNIVAEVNIHPDQRQDAVEFFTVCRAELDRLVEQSPSIPTDIIEAFESRFSEVNISKPEVCNILEPTTIFKPHNGEDWTKSTTPHEHKGRFNLLGNIFKKSKKEAIELIEETKTKINNNNNSNTAESDVENVITFDNNTPKPKANEKIPENHQAILASLNK
jgi:hypothetical protein